MQHIFTYLVISKKPVKEIYCLDLSYKVCVCKIRPPKHLILNIPLWTKEVENGKRKGRQRFTLVLLHRDSSPPPNLVYYYLCLDRWNEIVINNNVIYLIKLGTTNSELSNTSPVPEIGASLTTAKSEGEYWLVLPSS